MGILMANQNVGTPRFIIDWLQWYQATGEFDGGNHYVYNGIATGYGTNQGIGEERAAVLNVIGLNPASQTEFIYNGETEDNYNMQIIIKTPNSFPIENVNIIGVLGHNLSSVSCDNTNFLYTPSDASGYPNINLTDDFVINAELTNPQFNPSLDGFTFISVDGSISDSLDPINLQFQFLGTNTSNIHKIGSLLVGRYYDMPVAPDLSLSLEHDYSGIKKTTSMSGASFSNANWFKPPKWGDGDAWELRYPDGDFPSHNYGYTLSGRRVWDLSFSYISDSDLEPRNYTGTGEFVDESWVLGTDNWFENVLHYTMGGHLPFIFCPDPNIEYHAFSEGTVPPR